MKNRKTLILCLCSIVAVLLILGAALYFRDQSPASRPEPGPETEPVSQAEPAAQTEPAPASDSAALSVDYSAAENWAYYALGEDKDVR